MGLTSEKSLVEIQRLFDMCFLGNAIFDRQVYILDIRQNMPKFSEWFHENIAHQLPLWADTIQTFGSLRGDLFYRGAIEKQDKDYLKPILLLQVKQTILDQLVKTRLLNNILIP